jgi:hypothetical protein
MLRAGREPAEDIKRRIVSSCRAAGLEIQSACMRLYHDRSTRVIQVDAYAADGRFRSSILEITALVTTNGDWSHTVDVRAAAAEDDLAANVWKVPVLRGRETVPMADLVEQIVKTLEEREQVVAARKMGIEGPYIFERSTWIVPELAL